MTRAKRSKDTEPLRVAVYYPAEDAEMIQKAAARDGLPVTTWVRDAALAVAHSGRSVRRDKAPKLA